MSAPLTLAGLVARLRSEYPPDQISTHSLFHLRAALRVAAEFGTIENAPTLEDDPRAPTRGRLCGVLVVQDTCVPLGVAATMISDAGRNLHPHRTAALADRYASTARGFADRMGFLTA